MVNNDITATNLPSPKEQKYDLTLLYILSNYTNIEQFLEGYLRERRYAELKETVDEIKEKIPFFEQKKDELLEKQLDFENETLTEKLLNLTPTNLQILEAYQNATIYNIIYALWNWKVKNILPEIDQNAILEYYDEKLEEAKERQNLISKLWNLLRNLFRRRNDEDGCHANKPECVRQVMNNLNEEQKAYLERAIKIGDLTGISKIMEQKIFESPNFQAEYNSWNAQNNVPRALQQIVQGLSEAQLSAMENLRRLDLKDAIKDYYRGMIEKRTAAEQQEIEDFFQRMNRTFAKCYNPSKLKEASQEIANKIEEWKR